MTHRCELCGGFHNEWECTVDPSPPPPPEPEAVMETVPEPVVVVVDPPPEPASEPQPVPDPGPPIGTIVSGASAVYVVVSKPDEDGMVGLSPLHERVRIKLQDLEEI